MSFLVTLNEYETKTVGLPYAVMLALKASAGTALSFEPADAAGKWNIKASGRVGTIVAGEAKVLIRPKVAGANLFHMLEADGCSLQIDSAAFEYDVTGDLLAAFSTFFARVLAQALVSGLPRVYVGESDLLLSVRGRIDVTHQTRLGGLPLPVACDFDEHTTDSQLCRIVLAATQRLAYLPGVSVATRQALRRAVAEFEGVGRLRPVDLDRPTHFTRLNQHFVPVERLARLVLDGASIHDRAGSASAGSFLVNMATLFERFVEQRLRRYLPVGLTVSGQETTTLDLDGSVNIRPDLVFRSGGAAAYVGDCKYKLTASGFGREADYYQMLAYCEALGLEEGMLIYCQYDGTVPNQMITTRGLAGTRLRTVPIRLDGSPDEVDGRLEGLAGEIWLLAV